ncbi:hypothetical protein DRE_04933 [Drechslerella stenobrocha 248]|uniref:Conserved oligomeric Golgi complex subunit 5 N-terminal domain-containing protein n=1 Tax=Drechslerella stenobrocha 248 TaxID=1043628 RepID=W7HP90_9PEZI|nr:hypothetical protein DRE_04933 [Drechslerella stenobrocha 248]
MAGAQRVPRLFEDSLCQPRHIYRNANANAHINVKVNVNTRFQTVLNTPSATSSYRRQGPLLPPGPREHELSSRTGWPSASGELTGANAPMTSLNDPSPEVADAANNNGDVLNSSSPSYIDFDIFLDSEFSPYSFANTLIHATNNPSDITLDLSTPLSRVLFDLQEIDTHIHTLTTGSAETLLTHAKTSHDNSRILVESIREQLDQLSASYARLSREVLDRHDIAKPLSTVVENLARTTRLLRGCTRCLLLGRQLEVQLSEAIPSDDARGPRRPRKEDPKALIRAAYTIVELRRMYTNATGEAPGLETLDVMKTLLNTVITPDDRIVKARAQQTIKEFSLSPSTTATAVSDKDAATSEIRTRATAAILVLHILSPTSYTAVAPPGIASAPSPAANPKAPTSLLTSTITTYLQSQLTTSLSSLGRSLTTLSTLDRTLTEVSTRAANIVALERIIQSIPANVSTNPSQLTFSTPSFDPVVGLTDTGAVDSELISDDDEDEYGEDEPAGSEKPETEKPKRSRRKAEQETLLTPLLVSLDTPSLTTHFFRTLASNLDPRVREIMAKGGLAAKNLRENRDRVRNGLRDCVIKGVNTGNAAGSRGASTAADGKGLEGLVGMMFGAVASLGR